MKITIITVTKNNKNGLIRAIESVRSQTYKNVEHVIVDGGSTDGSVDVINNLAYRQAGLQFTIKNDEKYQESSRTDVRDLKISPPTGRGRNDEAEDSSLIAQNDRSFDPPRRAGSAQDDNTTGDNESVILQPATAGRQAQDDKGKDDTLRQAQSDRQLTTNYQLVVISEADSGIYDAINKGIKLATGDVIGLLHSDDFFADEFVLERYAEAFQQDKRLKEKGFIQDKRLKEKDKSFIQDKRLKRNDESIPSSRMNLRAPEDFSGASLLRNDRTQDDKRKDDKGLTNDNQSPTADNRQPNIDAVYSDLVYVRSKTREEKREQNNYESTDHLALNIDHSVLRNWKTHPSHFDYAQCDTDRITKLILNGWMPPHPTLFVRREVFDKYGLYRTDMKIAADYEMILRLFYKYNITTHYLPLTTYCMIIGGASNKSIRNIFIKSSEDYRAMKLHQVPFPIKTLLFKNLRKLPQFFR